MPVVQQPLYIRLAQDTAPGTPAPMEITSDTPAYCQKLLDRISDMVRLAATPVPHQVSELTTEGHRMCDRGQLRGGIMRLRSALLLMERKNGPAYR